MKKTKKMLAVMLALLLSMSTGITAFAFYQEPQSKKGLLISQQTYFDDILDLGVKQVLFNQTSGNEFNACLPLCINCKNNGITVTMIVLNDFNATDPNLVPVSEPVEGVGNYGFNVLTPEGEEAVRKYARNLVATYKDYVSNWVIGNEVNDASYWDYNGVMDIDEHADTEYGIAWHPYPVHFFTKPEFMDDDGISFDIETTPNINMKNLDLLTTYMQREDMLAPDGNVRHLILSEEGFTSACENGEERQAAAIKEAYEIAKANPYVDAFLLTRQVDAESQEAAGGAFGLWTRDPNASKDETRLSKKQSWYVYQGLE